MRVCKCMQINDYHYLVKQLTDIQVRGAATFISLRLVLVVQIVKNEILKFQKLIQSTALKTISY